MPEESLRHMSPEECFVLLGREPLGRVSVSIGALPAILPVNYTLFDGAIVLRTAPGTKLSAALMGNVVGFEIDGTNTDHTAGWSVVVVGHAREIHDDTTLERVRDLPRESWAPDHRGHFVQISIEHISGRAFGPFPGLGSTP